MSCQGIASESDIKGSYSRCQSPETSWFDPPACDLSGLSWFGFSPSPEFDHVHSRKSTGDITNGRGLPLHATVRPRPLPCLDNGFCGEEPHDCDLRDHNPQPGAERPARWKRGGRAGRKVRMKRERMKHREQKAKEENSHASERSIQLNACAACHAR
mmetsp:Transcript_24070/g.46208  ORF Transcript_24070/g.46208 Transcript_24070/m.46208 type:complete len:157 (-) Transcript_24070:113-583(-)